MTDSDNDTQYQARSVEDVGSWHIAEVRRAPWLGRPTAALPTFGPEGRFIGAFETRLGVLAKGNS